MDTSILVQLTEELIKYRTVRESNTNLDMCVWNNTNFIKEIKGCMDFVHSSLHSSIIIDNVDGYTNGAAYPITIAKFYDDKKPDLLIIGHIDVVAGEDSQFQPHERDGKIYGRGSKDMKSGVAIMIEVMNHFAAMPKKPNIAIAVVSDEESGGYNGANLIVNKMGYRPKFVITLDPGEKHCIINKEKGFLWLTITAFGKSSHPSRPWLADSAYEKIFNIWKDISTKYDLAREENDWRSSASLLEINKVLQMPDGTYSIDNSHSIAGIANCKIDIRYTETESVNEIKSELKKIVKKYGRENKIEFTQTGQVCYTTENNKYLEQFKLTVDSIEHNNIPFCVSAGASDLRFFSEKNIPCLNFGPTGKNHHVSNESVNITSIKKVFCALIKYIDNYLLSG